MDPYCATLVVQQGAGFRHLSDDAVLGPGKWIGTRSFPCIRGVAIRLIGGVFTLAPLPCRSLFVVFVASID